MAPETLHIDNHVNVPQIGSKRSYYTGNKNDTNGLLSK